MNDNPIERLSAEWANLDPVDPLRGLIRDAIAALSEARAAIEHQSVPAGWMLVPIEPSDEWIARLESQQTGGLESVDADAIRQCIVELLAAAPQPQPVQPTANSGDAEKAELDRMAKYVSTITQSEIDEADGDRGITSPQAQPAKPLTKAQRAKVCVNAEAAMQRDQNLSWRDALITETEQAHGIPKGTT